MPIKPENKTLYPANWKEIRERILRRAEDKCEQCRVHNRRLIARGILKDAGTFMVESGDVYCDKTGARLGRARMTDYNNRGVIKVVLTIAHMDHKLVDHSDDNLKALCQMCHLRHDRSSHIETRRETAKNKKATGDLYAR